jgi:uncharacterized membrane-anchored protein
VTLFLILVSPAFAIDESEFEKKVFALDWKTEPGVYELIGTNSFLKITSEEVLVLGEEAKKYSQLTEGHDINKPDAIVSRIEGPQINTQVNYQYVEDDYIEMDDWGEYIDKDSLIEEVIKATEEANKIRDKSIPKLYVDGWVEPPVIDKESAIVYWAFSGHSEGGFKFVNAKAMKLGRKGYTIITWIGRLEQFENAKESLDPTLFAYTFDEGSRYLDFVAGTDKVAALGVGALAYKLITGKKASKTGLAGILAALAIFAKKFWFIIFIPFVFAWKWIKGLFKGNKGGS